MKTIIIYYCDYCVKSQTYLLLFAFYGFACVPFCVCSKNHPHDTAHYPVYFVDWRVLFVFFVFSSIKSGNFSSANRIFMFSIKWAHCFRFWTSLFLFLTDAKLRKHIRVRIRILKLCNARNRGIAHCSHSKIEQHRKQKQNNTQKKHAIIVIPLWMFRNHRYCALLCICLSCNGPGQPKQCEHSSLWE